MEGEGHVDTVAEAFEHLAFSHKAKSRLKNSINMEDLLASKPVKFEVDTEDIAAELALDDDDDEMLLGLDTSYAASFFSEKTQASLAKNGMTCEVLASMDFISASFEDLAKPMVSIYQNGLVMKEVVRAGTGKKVPENGKVFAHYIAVCEGADEPHDSTIMRRVPAIFDMRKADMLPGFFNAILSMELNEVSKFIVKSSLAFGKNGCPPRIPPDADILYIVEILQVIDEKMLQSPMYMTADERALLPFQQIHDIADKLRTAGNGYFVNQEIAKAIKKYRKAVSFLEDYPLTGAKDEDDRNKLLHTLYANLAQCYLNQNKPEKACTMCKLGLRSAKKKDNVKLLFRFAKAKLLLEDYDSCISLCDQALQHEPNNMNVKDLKRQASVENSRRNAAAADMFRGILKSK